MWPPLYTQPPPSTLNEGDDRGLPGEVLTLKNLCRKIIFMELGSVTFISDSGGSIVEGVTVEPGHGTSKDMDS